MTTHTSITPLTRQNGIVRGTSNSSHGFLIIKKIASIPVATITTVSDKLWEGMTMVSTVVFALVVLIAISFAVYQILPYLPSVWRVPPAIKGRGLLLYYRGVVYLISFTVSAAIVLASQNVLAVVAANLIIIFTLIITSKPTLNFAALDGIFENIELAAAQMGVYGQYLRAAWEAALAQDQATLRAVLRRMPSDMAIFVMLRLAGTAGVYPYVRSALRTYSTIMNQQKMFGTTAAIMRFILPMMCTIFSVLVSLQGAYVQWITIFMFAVTIAAVTILERVS